MNFIRVCGGNRLRGTLRVQGAKNAALPILAATLLCGERCELRGCPDISDVHTAVAILRSLGCEAAFDQGIVTVDAKNACITQIAPALAGRMRSSVTFLGPLLARFGAACVPLPGGCVLGTRPLDLHLAGLEALGAEASCAGGAIVCRGRLHGGTVILRYPSVGATENLMLAACGACAPVTVLGAAKEPEIEDLAGFLNACGADVRGAGSARICVHRGVRHGCVYDILSDRMAAASYLCVAAACGGSLTLLGARPAQIKPVLDTLCAAGCRISAENDRITLAADALHAAPPVVTGPYPAFPTDAQAPVMAALLRAEGTTVFDETVFENRYRHVPALCRLGADIRVQGSIASVRGVCSLRGAVMEATDLRGGAAMLIAALSAEGESRIYAPEHLARGYEHLTENLTALGARITNEAASLTKK